ncbi:alpha/beta fold hydrolase [Arthrobacter sulfonylureivorans]|uniref:alpha/beta fold hydrolase n=1 Tax=Arthrobacter sulfonylureivorans TaxID=2486855 RepID=UPI0039E30A9C
MKPFRIDPAGHLEVSGRKVTYYEGGKEQAGAGQLVFVHGTSGTFPEHFGEIASLLAPKAKVYGLDMDSSTSDGAALELADLVLQVETLLDEVVPSGPTTLVGYSLGAVVAAAVAARRPEAVDQLVLIAGWAATGQQQRLFNRVWADLWSSGSPALSTYMFNHFFGGPSQDSMPPGMADQIIQTLTMTDVVARQMDLNDRIDITDELARIQARTLVIGCTHDQLVPLRQTKLLFGGIHDARFQEITAGHAVIYERTAELVRSLDHFHSDPTRHPAGVTIPNLVA